MFESLEVANGRSGWGRVRALLVSIFIHAVMLTVAVVLPLVFLQALPGVDLLTYLVAAPPPPEAPSAPPPPPRARSAAAAQPVPARSAFEMPRSIPDRLPAPAEEAPVVGIVQLPAGIGIAGSLAGSSAVPGISSSLLAAADPPAPPLPPPSKRDPVPVGGKVQEAKLIRKVLPEYTGLARSARAEGEVVLEVRIDEEGNVSDVKVLKGHPLLETEAVRAVRQWKYSPTLLNGEPVAVLSTVTVIFRLSGRVS